MWNIRFLENVVPDAEDIRTYMSWVLAMRPLLVDARHLSRARRPRLFWVSAQAFVPRQEYRGSDVRLDVGTLYRPDAFPRATVNPHRWRWHEAHSYPFQDPEHINILELRALIHTVEWRLRKMQFNGVRFLHLCDSQVALIVSA